MRFTVDPWDPSYGASLESELVNTEQEPDVEIEVPAAEWAPRRPPAEVQSPDVVVFVDGVRRLDARAWIELPDTDAVPGIFASYAAGAVRCAEAATIETVAVGRGLFAPVRDLDDVVTRHGTFTACHTKDATPESINYAVHERMTECEVRIAETTRRNCHELVVVDGPLRKAQHVRDAVGLVKTHHVRHLPERLNPVVGALAVGERTPIFRIEARPFGRHSWYLRLPGPSGGPWAGVVRCEAGGTLAVTEVAALADTVTVALPRFASVPHKDPRAPQNLAPIGALERILRHRLGDAQICYRALRAAGGCRAVSSP